MKLVEMEDCPDCIICGAKGMALYENLRDVRYGIEGIFGMRSCSMCGLLWLSPRVVQKDVHEYYSHFFRSHVPVKNAHVFEMNFWDFFKGIFKDLILCGYYGYRNLHKRHFFCGLGRFLGCIPFFRMKATWELEDVFLPFQKDLNKKVLVDVGCGEGFFLEFMKNLGWGVFGIEPHEVACRTLEQKGIPFFRGTIEEAKQLPADMADQVTLTHVLEHVYDPAAAIAECFRLLKKGGRLIVKVPNAESLAHKFFKQSCYHLDPPRHLFSFSPQSLQLLFKKSPFGQGISLTTTIFKNRTIYDFSWDIMRNGKLYGIKARRHIGRLLFFLIELFMVLLGRQVGEEIRVVAIK